MTEIYLVQQILTFICEMTWLLHDKKQDTTSTAYDLDNFTLTKGDVFFLHFNEVILFRNEFSKS